MTSDSRIPSEATDPEENEVETDQGASEVHDVRVTDLEMETDHDLLEMVRDEGLELEEEEEAEGTYRLLLKWTTSMTSLHSEWQPKMSCLRCDVMLPTTTLSYR